MFEELWTRNEYCHEVIKAAWESAGDIGEKLSHTVSKLQKWSREKFGDAAKELRACKIRMSTLMEEEKTEEFIAEMRAVDNRMDELEDSEEVY